MESFLSYLNHLKSLVDLVLVDPQHIHSEAVSIALDGGPAQALRESTPVEALRDNGAFFTGNGLARIAVQSISETLDSHSVVLDLACGTGDLLVECAKYLPKGEDLQSTLKIWGSKLIGHDIHSAFIEAAKARLVLTAIQEGVLCIGESHILLDDIFPNIVKRNGLQSYDSIKLATHILLNPPYVRVQAPATCLWSKGKVNSAALFLEACVLHAQLGTRIVAILPDVLRSGSNYRNWRKLIESRSKENRIGLYGQFDRWADVDVFVIDLEVEHSPKTVGTRWNQPQTNHATVVGDRFTVHVGSVVEYRDPQEGSTLSYITPKNVSPWETVINSRSERKYSGSTYEPPFVVVRRTSRKGHRHRAIGTIINVSRSVAVENHLLVLIPKEGTLEECKELLRVLQDQRTTEWLNQRILCRHLTVSSLAEVPWWNV